MKTRIETELTQHKKRLVCRLKDARHKNGISQAQLAEILGSKQPAIARMESGDVDEISMDFLLKASLALGISVTFNPWQYEVSV